jgi:hypothetical protein
MTGGDMTTIRPATLHRAEDPRLADLAAVLTGDRVTGVRYVMPTGVGWTADDALDNVHEVEMGVEVVVGSGRVLTLEWATPGIDEGLSIAVRDPGESPEGPGNRVDVSDDARWAGIVGHRIDHLAVAFFEHYDDASVRPWSFRISVDGGAGATVALGEIDGSEIGYLPDNLVVIFDEATARGYRIADALQPAWGSVI